MRTKSINPTYFIGCKSFDEVKKKYKELVKQYHPDRNSQLKDDSIIKELNVQYEYIQSTYKSSSQYPITSFGYNSYSNSSNTSYTNTRSRSTNTYKRKTPIS